ncbi:MAG: ATP-binding protein, partial [Spirochaetales bacterium]|nr:ATP-binding protein [Spirochaetales bacterium]
LQDLSYFSRFFKQTAMDDIPMDQEKLRYREFTDLGVYANRMVGEKKKREEEKHRLRNLESLGFLASGIAHEFNNALMGIFGNIELSLQNPEDKQNIQLHLERALEAMDYTKSLTNRLLTFSKGGQPNCELLSLGELVREAGENWQEKERFSFVNTLASSDFRIKADKTQLLLVMDMLFSNAYEAMKEKGTLTVRGKRVTLENAFPSRLTGSYIRLDIEDTGKGIDEKIREKIFDLYFSTKLTGHGLGLPTAYNILKNHRGHMEIQSVKGRGTTVSLYLPEADLSTEADSTDLE